MDNPEVERTVINVRGVSVASWNRAKAAANRQGETMGDWISRAVDQLAAMQAGQREYPPVNPLAEPVKPASMDAAQLADVMRGVAALAGATGVRPAVRDVRGCYRLAAELVRQARGLPPRSRRINAGKTVAVWGKTGE